MTSAAGGGRFGTGVTVYTYVAGSEYPVTGREAAGGVTQEGLRIAPGVFVYNGLPTPAELFGASI